MPFTATWMGLEVIIVRQTERQYHMILLICKNIKKMVQINLFTKLKQTQRLRELAVMVRGKGWPRG